MILVTSASKYRARAHTRRCGSIKKAKEEKIREVKRRKRPNLPVCKKCTDPVDRTEIEQNHVVSDLRGLWADD